MPSIKKLKARNSLLKKQLIALQGELEKLQAENTDLRRENVLVESKYQKAEDAVAPLRELLREAREKEKAHQETIRKLEISGILSGNHHRNEIPNQTASA